MDKKLQRKKQRAEGKNNKTIFQILIIVFNLNE